MEAITVIVNTVTDVIENASNNKNYTKESVKKNVLSKSLAIFKDRKNLSRLTNEDYKKYSDVVNMTLDKLSNNGIKQAKEIKKNTESVLEKLKKKVFNALKEEIISLATGIPDEIFDVIDVSNEVKKTFKPRLNPYKTAEQQYEEYLLNKRPLHKYE